MKKLFVKIPLNESTDDQPEDEPCDEEKSNDTASSSRSAQLQALRNDTASPSQDGRSSPETNCPICLGQPENKSFTDSCLHQFCFTCLKEWSKVKAECPLCKQTFKSIIHTVRSIEDYEQYYLTPSATEYEYETPGRIYEPNQPREPFRYRTTVSTYMDYFVRLEQAISMHVIPSAPDYQNYNTLPWRPHFPPSSSHFRRNVYQQGLWVQQTRDFSGRTRNCSPEFLRENPALTYRLVPWLNRELHVLCNDNEQHVQFVVQQILEKITQVPIRSSSFLDFISAYLGRHSEHFVHEFYCYATSPYDTRAYDRFSSYVSRDDALQLLSSEEDSDVQVVASLNPSAHAPSIQLEDSDSDDCVVLDSGPAPPRQTSPEVITLESEPDDDVVQVNIHIETDHNQPGPSRRSTLKRNRLKVKNVKMETPSNDNVNVSINIAHSSRAHSSRTRSSSSDSSSSSWSPPKSKAKLTKRKTKSKSRTKSKAKVSKKVNRDRSASPVLTTRKRKPKRVINSSSEGNSDGDSSKLKIITDHYSSSDSSDDTYKPRLRSVVFKSTAKPKPKPRETYSDLPRQSSPVSGGYWDDGHLPVVDYYSGDNEIGHYKRCDACTNKRKKYFSKRHVYL